MQFFRGRFIYADAWLCGAQVLAGLVAKGILHLAQLVLICYAICNQWHQSWIQNRIGQTDSPYPNPCVLYLETIQLQRFFFEVFMVYYHPDFCFFFCLWKGNHLENALTLSNFIDGFRRWMHASDRWAQAGLEWNGRKVVKLPIQKCKWVFFFLCGHN